MIETYLDGLVNLDNQDNINNEDSNFDNTFPTEYFNKNIFKVLFKNGDIDLQENQLEAILNLLQNKKSVLTFEMGLGKTPILLAVASVLMLKAMKEDKLVILSVPSPNIESFREIVNNQLYLKDRIMFTDGNQKNINKFLSKWDNNEINLVICQHSCWTFSKIFNFEIFNRREKVLATLYDEAIEKNALGYANFVALSEHISEYVVMSTASFSGSVSSFKENDDSVMLPTYNLLKAVSLIPTNFTYKMFLKKFTTSVYKNGNIQYVPNIDHLKEYSKDRIVNLSRHHIGLETEFNNIEFLRSMPSPNMLNYINKTSDSYRRILYGEVDYINYIPSEIPSLAKLIELLFRLDKTTNKIIYCNHIQTTIHLKTMLTNLGYDVMTINGVDTKNSQEKDKATKEFNSRQGTIMITNIIKGINLDSASDIITLSIPSDLPQFIARATRGYKKGEINLYIIYYPTHESATLRACLDMIKMNDNTLDRGYTKLITAFENELNNMHTHTYQ